MTGELITFPIRVGLRAARVAVRGGVQASERAIALASFVVKTVTSSGSRDDYVVDASATEERAPEKSAPGRRPSAPEPRMQPSRTQAAPPSPPAPPAPSEPAAEQAPPLTEPPPTEPVHVSEEPTLVEEFAEPGAEDGAGAQVTIAEPWDGYAHLNAKEVIARVSDANAVELAAVQLYEAAHRNRETVMTVVERELRAKSGRGAATADQTRKEHTNGG
ncbi:MAG: hypothetical protein QOD66_542 [Solirubrobacteraceae bacterium]|jgi:hypothetical protein|nr:hypothetical protein [Solirubrobacteraceae bacterium]